MLLLGVDPNIVMVIGGWTSKAFLEYWRQSDEILAMFVGFAMSSYQSVITTMANFKANLVG